RQCRTAPALGVGRQGGGQRVFQVCPRHPAGQLRQGMAQIDLVLQAGAEQVVGVGGNTVRGNGALAHKLVRNCKKTAVIVAKTCSPGTREMRQRRYTSCVKWVLQGRRNTRYPGMACVADTPFPDPLGTTSAMSSWYRPCQNCRPMHAKKDSASSPQQWKHKD